MLALSSAPLRLEAVSPATALELDLAFEGPIAKLKVE
jgi:hypothetical protein